jgi:hypothetical protein
MHRGYVRLYRKSLDSGLIRNHNAWILFTYCLLKATHKQYKAVVGNQEIFLKPGQLIFGRRLASEETGLSEQQIRTALRILAIFGILTIKSTNKFSIITIVNWDVYQKEDGQSNQQINQQSTSNQPHTKTKEHKNNNNNTATEIFDFYLIEIEPAERTKQRALSNIQSHLKKYSLDDLKQSIRNYAGIALTREPNFRKDPANFFGKRDPAFIDYLPENFQAPATAHRQKIENQPSIEEDLS